MITQEQLKKAFYYNQYTGNFIRKSDRKNARYGSIAGDIKSNGYRYINLLGERNLSHRLAFLYMEGEMPEYQVDHVNHDRTDNRWRNLRHATHRQNMNNLQNHSEFRGVVRHKQSGLWQAQMDFGCMDRYIGLFKTHFAACYARHAAEVSR